MSRLAAHPRSRGENMILFSLVIVDRGSSPLTRGKPVRSMATEEDSGLIPAHAGKTVDDGDQAIPRTAHPRSRGENATCRPRSTKSSGSSPLTRGKQSVSVRLDTRIRLIPAHAGKTSYAATIVACFAAHPRSRGENAQST